MSSRDVIQVEDTFGANAFAKRPLVLAKGSGATVWDLEGREYIDCTGSYGSCLVGYCHPKIAHAISEQATTLSSCHGYAYNPVRAELMSKLVRIAPRSLTKVFLSNSGTESVECALKVARRYAGKKEIIAMVGGFHGKTLGALSATWNMKYREPFQPLVPGFRHVPYGSLEKAEEAVTPDTAAIIVEPIQGESGVKVPPEGYLKGLRELCDRRNILLIIDEVQTGFGRTGKMFACEHWDVAPDILCCAKGAAGGLPIGITLAREDVMTRLGRGEHSSTYGGNPIIAAAASTAIDIIVEEKLPQKAAELGSHLLGKLKGAQAEYKIIREARGRGLMIGVEFRFDILGIINGCMSRGVLVLDAGRTVVRLLPPLAITSEQLDRAYDVIVNVVEEKERTSVPRPPP